MLQGAAHFLAASFETRSDTRLRTGDLVDELCTGCARALNRVLRQPASGLRVECADTTLSCT